MTINMCSVGCFESLCTTRSYTIKANTPKPMSNQLKVKPNVNYTSAHSQIRLQVGAQKRTGQWCEVREKPGQGEMVENEEERK